MTAAVPTPVRHLTPLTTRVIQRWQIVWQGHLDLACNRDGNICYYCRRLESWIVSFLLRCFLLSFLSTLIPVWISSSCCLVRAAGISPSSSRTSYTTRIMNTFCFLSPLVVDQIRGHIWQALPPYPLRFELSIFYREKIWALSSLVDSRRIVLTHTRRSQLFILSFFFFFGIYYSNKRNLSCLHTIRMCSPRVLAVWFGFWWLVHGGGARQRQLWHLVPLPTRAERRWQIVWQGPTGSAL